MGDFKTDQIFELKFARPIRNILAEQFIERDYLVDVEGGTDFLILSVKPFRVAVRLRRYKFIQYRDEFTIRWSRPSGIRTEIHKINAGLVRYILYGFVDKEEKDIIEYFIGDLDIFRKINPEPKDIIPNKPHDSDLAIYPLNLFPDEFTLKRVQAKNINVADMPRVNPILTDRKLELEDFF